MVKFQLFLLSLVLTTAGWSARFYLTRPKPSNFQLVRIADNVYITSQLKREDIHTLTNRGIKTIVDIRPDGEANDQTPSSEIERASKDNDMDFYYLPVPHESIPEDAVQTLSGVLFDRSKPILLYCRTGRRAARTFALAQASQSDGPNCDAILKTVQAAGFSADDLKSNIAERIAHRSSHEEIQK